MHARKAILERAQRQTARDGQGVDAYETIDEEQIKDIMEGREPRPPEDWEDPDETSKPKAGKKKRKGKAAPGPIGGPASEH
jgi:cell division protease FtsH